MQDINITYNTVGVTQSEEDAAQGQDEVGREILMADCLAETVSGMLGVQHCSVGMEGEYSGASTKEARGVCEVDIFCGVSLSSIVYKVMCMILNVRLSTVAEGLIAKEQGWF